MNALDTLFLLSGAYCRATGLAEATLSSRMLGDGKRLAAIREKSDIGVRRLNRAIRWLSDNWPADAAWPEGVARPAPQEAAS